LPARHYRTTRDTKVAEDFGLEFPLLRVARLFESDKCLLLLPSVPFIFPGAVARVSVEVNQEIFRDGLAFEFGKKIHYADFVVVSLA
jgi:hypothetical protein